MNIDGTIFCCAYLLTWWVVFWLPLKKGNPLRFLAFIPAVVCALGVPVMISDKQVFDQHKGLSTEPHRLLLLMWLVLPVAIVVLELAFKLRNRKKSEQSAAASPSVGRQEAD